MGAPFFDPDSVIRRLDQSICMYNNQPVYVEVVRDPPRNLRDTEYWHQTRIFDLPYGVSPGRVVDYREDLFDYKATQLGYMNFQSTKMCYYLTRNPRRQQTQGLTQRQLTCLPNSPPGSFILTSEMKDCILGVHPGYDQAMKSIKDYKWSSRAISRTTAIERKAGTIFLCYRGHPIGSIDGNYFRLYESKMEPALRYALKNEIPLR